MSRTTRVTLAYDEIKRRILDNEYPAGYQSLEQEVAEQLGFSRTPVREALIRLKNEGLVELIPRRGMRVVPLSPDDMREIYELLTALESTAAESLARRKPDEAELAPLAEAISGMDDALESDDLEAWAAWDEQYHNALLQLCGNSRLAGMASTVRDQGRRARMVTLRLRPKPWQSNVEHRAVLDAIRRGDAEEAREKHYLHRRNASRTLMELLQKYGLPQL